MTALAWLAGAIAVSAWPLSVRPVRLAALVAAGRLEPSAPAMDVTESVRWPSGAVVTGVGVVAVAASWSSGRATALAAGGAAAVVAAVITGLVQAARSDRRRRRETDDLVLVLGLLGSELEAGATAAGAVAATRTAAPDLGAALSRAGPCARAGPISVAWRISEETGAPLAQVLAQVRRDVDAERALRRAVALAVAGPKSSAALLALLPLLGIGLGAAIGADPIAVLFGSPTGHVLLMVGVVLDAAGVLWSHRLIRRAQAAP